MTETTARSAAREAAVAAIDAWTDAVFDDLHTLTVTEHRDGANPVIVMTGVAKETGDEGEGEFLEALAGVIVADESGKTLITGRSTSPEMWADLVQLWSDTRDVISHNALYAAETSIVVDLSNRAVAAFEAGYCPDMSDGPEADLVFEIARPGDPDLDEFDQFLSTLVEEDASEDPEDRILSLLDQYGINPPGVPLHEKGQCPYRAEGH